ncbi:MAG: response regulator [Planctomycetes bacterium]|nr:response regulator [Planctomycetota bacterium]
MKKNVIILIAESNQDHYLIIEKNLRRTGIGDEIKRFDNGRALTEFLFTPERQLTSYILILDINIEGFDGLEILRKIKSDSLLRKMPVVIFTSQQDKTSIDKCYDLGCSVYILKPRDVTDFSDTVHKIGKFLLTVKVPRLNS